MSLMILSGRLLKIANSLLLAACTVVTAAMDPPPRDFHIVRLAQVKGDAGKMNDIVFCGHRRQADSNVIFFTGDVQDYKEKMMAHRDNHRHAKWDVESTAKLLLSRFPRSHVWVIKAVHMELGTFSIYSNFVTWKSVSDGAGGPTHSPGQRSWHHLEQLMTNAVKEMNSCSDSSSDTCSTNMHASGTIQRSNLPVVLIGFSKGCVVLNQLAYDRATTLGSSEESDVPVKEFAKLATDAYWLDGGHAGGKETWITDDSVHRSLVDVSVHSHVTPYQVKDGSRPWIGKEQKRFIAGLTKHNVTFTNSLHFADKRRSLENHFRILETF